MTKDKETCKGRWCTCEIRCMCEQFKLKGVKVLNVDEKLREPNETQTEIQTSVNWKEENVLENFLNQWRRVEHKDMCNLQKLVTKTTEEIFGPIDFPNLIEHSYLFLCIVNYRKEIVGAICINDFPQFSTISRTEWEDWMYTKFREEDNDRIIETIEDEEPELIKFYGKKLAADIISFDQDRRVYVAKEGAGLLAVACTNLNVNTETLQKMFSTGAFNGFQKATNADYAWTRRSGRKIRLSASCSALNHTITNLTDSDDHVSKMKINSSQDAGVMEGIVWSTLLMHDADLEEEESEGSEFKAPFEEFPLNEFTSYRNLCMAIPSSAVLNTLDTVSPFTKIENYFGPVNAFLIDFLMTGNMSNSESLNLLNDIFEDLEKYDYALVALERNQEKPEFAFHMLKVPPRKHLMFDDNLYFYHRWFYTGRFFVREAEVADYPELLSIISPMLNNNIYEKEVSRALYGKDELRAFVLQLFGIIIGFSIVCPEKNPEYLKFHFNIEKYMEFKLHNIPNHGYVKHFMLEDFTPLCGLNYWMPISPRMVPIFCPSLRENQPSFLMANDYPPFALYYTNYRLASLNRNFYDNHIVVVGASETGLSFIENLIFKQNTPYNAAVNITLVTMHEYPRKYKHQHIIELMMPKHGVYNLKYLSKLGLENVIRIVSGSMTAIDRDVKQIVVDNTKFIMYDYLFLFCGTQFGNPEMEKFQDFERRCTVPYDMKSTLKMIDREHPQNLFTLNAPCDAHHALEYIKRIDPTPSGKIIIYGNHIGGYSCIQGLLTLGIPGYRIMYVETKFDLPYAIDQFNDPTVYREIRLIMKALKIEVLKNYVFSSWDIQKDTGKIEKVYFESQNNITSVECMAMFNFSKKQVDIKTVIALIKAHLVYDGRLVVDENFNTNDPYIFAAGPMTKYPRSYYAEQYYHEYYNSSEVGEELATRVPEIIKMPGCARLSPSGIIRFLKPKVTNCMLPGMRYCLLVRKPGPIMPLQTTLSTQKDYSKILLTGQIPNPHQIGYFRIIMDKSNSVTDMVCVSSIPIDARNLVNIYGKHEFLLNNIVARYYSQLIEDFYEFFKQPWAYVIYHDRFQEVLDEIQRQYLKKLPNSKWTFLELVGFAYSLNKWKKLPEKSGMLLEDVFSYVPILRERINSIFLEFVKKSSDLLPMFVTDSYLKNVVNTSKSDIIFDFQNIITGQKSFVNKRVDPSKPVTINYGGKIYEEV